MTIYETLKALTVKDIKDDYSIVKFEDVVKQMEKIRGKRYYIFEYKDIERTLRILNMEIKLPVFNSAKKQAAFLLETGDYETLIHEVSTLQELDGWSDGTMLNTKDTLSVIHGWKEFKSVLKSHMDNAL